MPSLRTFENGTPRFLEGTTIVRRLEGVTVPPATNAVLREDSSYELREDGSLILRET